MKQSLWDGGDETEGTVLGTERTAGTAQLLREVSAPRPACPAPCSRRVPGRHGRSNLRGTRAAFILTAASWKGLRRPSACEQINKLRDTLSN